MLKSIRVVAVGKSIRVCTTLIVYAWCSRTKRDDERQWQAERESVVGAAIQRGRKKKQLKKKLRDTYVEKTRRAGKQI